MQNLEVPDTPFNTEHIDISRPYPSAFKENRYIIALTDSFSKWPKAYSVPNVTSDQIAEALAKFVCRYGCPKVLMSDRGTNLINNAIEKVHKRLEIKQSVKIFKKKTHLKVFLLVSEGTLSFSLPFLPVLELLFLILSPSVPSHEQI